MIACIAHKNNDYFTPLFYSIMIVEKKLLTDRNDEGQEQQKISLYSISADIIKRNGEEKIIVSSCFGNLCRKIREHPGVLYILATNIIASACTFSLKFIPADVFDLMITRFAVQSVVFGIFAAFYKGYDLLNTNGQPLACTLNVLMSSLTNLLYLAAFYFLPLSDLNTIKHTYIVWAAILSVLFLKDRFKVVNGITLFLTCIGFILATKSDLFVTISTNIFSPSLTATNVSNITISSSSNTTIATNSTYYYLGVFLASVSALTKSIQFIARKQLVKTKLPYSVMNFQFTTVALLVSIIYSIIRRFWRPEPYPWRWMGTFGLIVGCFQLLTNILVPKAMKRENVQFISILGSLDIVYAVILQYIFFRQTKSWVFYFGASLIVFSAIILSIDRHLENQREQRKSRTMKIDEQGLDQI